MASIEEIKSYIRSNYKVNESSELLWSLAFGIDDSRSQMILVGFLDSYISVSSPFAQTSDISAEKALDLASGSPFGVKSTGDFYTLQHAIPVKDVDASEVEFGFERLAVNADLLERQVGGDRF